MISSSVMSLLRIETCFVPAGALAAPARRRAAVLAPVRARPPPVEGDALPCSGRDDEHDADQPADLLRAILRGRSSIRRTLLSGPAGPSSGHAPNVAVIRSRMPSTIVVGHGPGVGDRVRQVRVADVPGEPPHRRAGGLPIDPHRLGPDVHPGAMEPAEDDLRLVVLEDGPQVGAEPDGLSVDEAAAGLVLQAYRNAWSTPSRWRAFQPASWNAAPPQRWADISSRIPASLTSWISSRPATTASSCSSASATSRSSYGHRRSSRPASWASFQSTVGGVVAEDVADAAPVEQRRGAPDHVDVDVDGLRHGPAEADLAALVTQRRSGGRTRAFVVIAVGTWKSGRPRRQAKNFATSSAWPPPRPMTPPNSGSPSICSSSSASSIVVTSWTPARWRSKWCSKPRPQVGHRHDEVGPVDEVRQLRDELASEDRRKPRSVAGGSARRRSRARAEGRHGPPGTAGSRAGRRSTAPPDLGARPVDVRTDRSV